VADKHLIAAELNGDRVDIERRIGHGTEGTVYACRRAMADRRYERFALKVGSPDHKNFGREGYLFQSRHMRHVIVPSPPMSLRWPDGTISQALRMELADGGSLYDEMRARRFAKQTFSPHETAALLVQAAIGLREAAQDANVVHRDVKPANLLFQDRLLQVADWGYAFPVGRIPARAAGTVGYLAPEAFRRIPLTEKIDVYALGMIGFEAVTGLPGRDVAMRLTAMEIEAAVINDREVRKTGIDTYFDLVLEEAMRSEPMRRSSVLDLLVDLTAYDSTRPHLLPQDDIAIAKHLLERANGESDRPAVLDLVPTQLLLERWNGDSSIGDALKLLAQRLALTTPPLLPAISAHSRGPSIAKAASSTESLPPGSAHQQSVTDSN
jgi:serine/threonine protein kinase